MIKTKNNKKIIYLIIVAIAIFAIVLFFKLSAPQTENNTTSTFRDSQNKIISSKFMNFTINVVNDYIINEDQTFIDLVSKNGKINISRISTNFLTIEDYLSDFDQKRKITVDSQEQLSIDSYNAIGRIEIFNGGPISQQKVYFIYVSNWVYALSTSSPELYGDLDQIARSFKYTP